MSFDEENEPSGIPTRAIHEAYLDMQRALKQYRKANDRGSEAATQQAHGEVQESVLTLYELLRPHLKQNSAVSDYWEGKPPSYPTDGRQHAPDPDDGVAILSWQIHPQNYALNGAEPGELETLRDWHNALDVSDTVRLHAVGVENGQVFARYQTYEMGLHHLDSWQTQFQYVQTEIGGFMGGKTTTKPVRQRVPIDKLRRAARELSNAAEKLGALSQFDASTPKTKITDELIEDVDGWRKETIEQ